MKTRKREGDTIQGRVGGTQTERSREKAMKAEIIKKREKKKYTKII